MRVFMTFHLCRVQHPHIVKVYELIQSENFVYVVTELAPNGELFSKTDKRIHFK